jgi:hypothetical protein
MPEIRMNSLKSLAMNCGPLSEMIRGRASGYILQAAKELISMSASVIDSRRSQSYWEDALSISSSTVHPEISVSGSEEREGNELMRKRPSDATSYWSPA